MLFYQRYIDDLFIIWQGTEESLREFSKWLNSNNNNIKLEFNWDKQQIHYLDVLVMKEEDKLSTKAFFKTTDQNSYIPVQSGHHPQWLRNIPKGQFMHIRRNCSQDSDYAIQAAVIKQRFIEKGYNEPSLDKMIEEVGKSSQELMLIPKERIQNQKHEWGFISQYHKQYREIESIFKKHWNILTMDKIFKSALPDTPPFIYRKTASFGEKSFGSA